MYLFFLIFFVFISISLIFFILLQPGKGLNTVNLNTKNNTKFFSGIGKNNFITNIIRIFSCLFLVTSIILCNINNRKIDSDFFVQDNYKKTVIQKNFLNKKMLNSDIPN